MSPRKAIYQAIAERNIPFRKKNINFSINITECFQKSLLTKEQPWKLKLLKF